MSDPKESKSIENLKGDVVNGETIKGGGIAPPPAVDPVDVGADAITGDVLEPSKEVKKDDGTESHEPKEFM